MQTLINIAWVGSILSCPLVVGYQALGWLKTGQWQGIALADCSVPALRLHGALPNWVAEPHSWYGLHVIVKFLLFGLPLWLWLVLAFYLIATWMESKAKEFSNHQTSLK
jgi:hypothetical protein